MWLGSIWLHQTQAVFHHARHSQTGENPELRTLFHKLNRFLNQSANIVFVFDGHERPSMKCGKHVRTREHWLAKCFQEFARVFGFSVHIVSKQCLPCPPKTNLGENRPLAKQRQSWPCSTSWASLTLSLLTIVMPWFLALLVSCASEF